MSVIAVGVATLLAVVLPIHHWYFTNSDDREYHPYVERGRAFLGERGRRILRPILIAVMWPAAYVYTEWVLLPILPKGNIQRAFVLFVGLGLGLPVAKHVTERDYSAFGGFRQ